MNAFTKDSEGGQRVADLKPSFFVNSKPLLTVVSILFVAFLLSVFFNVTVARQTIGFVYLTFVPGWLIAKTMKIGKLDVVEVAVLSVGLSVVFLMIMGLLLNTFLPAFGIQEPLSSTPLLIFLNTAILLLCLFSSYRSKQNTSLRGKMVSKLLSDKSNMLAIPIVALPVLSIIGALTRSSLAESNLVFIIMIAAIAVLLAASLFEKILPSSLYSLFLAAVAIALLFHSSLIYNHINGFDVQFEYRFMEATVASSRWIPSTYDKFQPLLSVSILPAIYWRILDIDGVYISNIIYPLIFSFVPLVLYKFFGLWVNRKMAFLSAFLVIATSEFYTGMLTLGRQMVGELFFVLLFFVIFTEKIGTLNKTLLFVLFSFALVSSHYATAEIFFFIILLTWLFTYFVYKRKTIAKSLKIYHVALFGVIMFFWYIYVSSSATFIELTNMLDFVYRNTFTEFFDFGSRGSTTLLGVGVAAPPSNIINLVGRLWAYITELLIVIGFVYLLARRRQEKFDRGFIIILCMNIILLILSVLLPGFAGSLGMNRLYHIVLLSVAPLFMLGVKFVSDCFSKLRKGSYTIALALLVLVPFFLFQTGFIYEATHVTSYSVPLSRYRFDSSQYLGLGIIETTDIFGVRWLSLHELSGSVTIYSDVITDSILIRGGYGMFSPNQTEPITSNTTQISSNGIVYLRYYNLFYNLVAGDSFQWNASSYVNSTLGDTNKIYSNGMCEIYKKP